MTKPKTNPEPQEVPNIQDIIDSGVIALSADLNRLLEKSKAGALSNEESGILCRYIKTITDVNKDLRATRKELDMSGLDDQTLNAIEEAALKINPGLIDALKGSNE